MKNTTALLFCLTLCTALYAVKYKPRTKELCSRPNTIEKTVKRGRLFEVPMDSITTPKYEFGTDYPTLDIYTNVRVRL